MPGSPSGQRITQKPLFLCKPFVTSQLVKGSFSTIVVLPRYVDQGEWLALNRMYSYAGGYVERRGLIKPYRQKFPVFEFFDMLNKFYGVVQEFCTPQNCPSMSAGPGYAHTLPPLRHLLIPLWVAAWITPGWTRTKNPSGCPHPPTLSTSFNGSQTGSMTKAYSPPRPIQQPQRQSTPRPQGQSGLPLPAPQVVEKRGLARTAASHRASTAPARPSISRCLGSLHTSIIHILQKSST